MSLPAAFSLALVWVVTVPLARPVPNWSYERLMRESDIVVVATAGAVENVDYNFSKDGDFGNFIGHSDPKVVSLFQKLAPRVTSFDVVGTIKGERRENVDVLHFYWRENIPIENGPRFIDFAASRKISVTTRDELMNTTSFGNAKPQFLLFLKIAHGTHGILGRYEPVSGQANPGLSVRLMIEP